MRGLLRLSFTAFLLFTYVSAAAAVELDGVAMPEAQTVARGRLALAGLALRTYSFLKVRIYVAALYLEHRTSDAKAILDSGQTKLLRFAFLRDVDAETARKSWAEAFEKSCPAPCHVAAESIDRFLAAVPAVRQGEIGTLLFNDRGMDFLLNGRLVTPNSHESFWRPSLASIRHQMK
jgi:hypothetical protein